MWKTSPVFWGKKFHKNEKVGNCVQMRIFRQKVENLILQFSKFIPTVKKHMKTGKHPNLYIQLENSCILFEKHLFFLREQ